MEGGSSKITEKFRSPLVFKGSSEKNLTQEAVYVCNLLAIQPEDLLPKQLNDFYEKGLAQQR